MDLRFIIHFILLILSAEFANAQLDTYGWIVDRTGQVLDGAKISEVGTENITFADKNGEFKLTVTDNSLIEISSVGYLDTIINASNLKGDTIELKMHIFIEDLSVVVQDSQNDTCRFEISIYQQMLPYSKWDISYNINSKRITIYKYRTRFIGVKEIDQRRTLYRKKLDDLYFDSLKVIVNDIFNQKIEGDYSSGWLDGINWRFDFKHNCNQMQVNLDNYYLPEIGRFMDYIDKMIPEKKRYISFDYFDIRKKFEEQ
jgi:hypothetical protein